MFDSTADDTENALFITTQLKPWPFKARDEADPEAAFGGRRLFWHA